MRDIETTEIYNVQGFVEEIAPTLGFQRQPIYRGQADLGWEIIPTLLREDVAQSEFKDWTELEASLIFRFKQRANRGDFGGHEPETELEWLTVAQYFGLPTRFTAWSENALAALYFATEMRDDKTDGVVWRLLPGDRNLTVTQDFEQIPERPQIYHPKHSSPEFLAQKTCFLSHALPEFDTKPLSFEDHFENTTEDLVHLCQIVIPHDAKRGIRQQLTGMGVDSRTLFPGLRGLCDTIKEEIYAHTDSYDWVFAT